MHLFTSLRKEALRGLHTLSFSLFVTECSGVPSWSNPHPAVPALVVMPEILHEKSQSRKGVGGVEGLRERCDGERCGVDRVLMRVGVGSCGLVGR